MACRQVKHNVPFYATNQPQGIALIGGNRRNQDGSWLIPLTQNQPIMNIGPQQLTVNPFQPLLTTITQQQLKDLEGDNYMKVPPPQEPKMVLHPFYNPLRDMSISDGLGGAARQPRHSQEGRRRRIIKVPPRTNHIKPTAEEEAKMRQEQIEQGLLPSDHSSDETDEEWVGPRTKEERQAFREESRQRMRQLAREGKRTHADAIHFMHITHPATGERMWSRERPRTYTEAERVKLDQSFGPDPDFDDLWSEDDVPSTGLHAILTGTSNGNDVRGEDDSAGNDIVLRDSRKQVAAKSKKEQKAPLYKQKSTVRRGS